MYSCDANLNFQHHYSSVTSFRNYSHLQLKKHVLLFLLSILNTVLLVNIYHVTMIHFYLMIR